MPLGLEFTWYRKFSDGRIEFEFDPETGKPTLWGAETPLGVIEAGWMPMTPPLAGKISPEEGCFGIPARAQIVAVRPKPGEELILDRERKHQTGAHATCEKCGKSFLSSTPPVGCIFCGDGRLSLKQAEWETAIYEIGIKGRFMQKFNSMTSITE